MMLWNLKKGLTKNPIVHDLKVKILLLAVFLCCLDKLDSEISTGMITESVARYESFKRG